VHSRYSRFLLKTLRCLRLFADSLLLCFGYKQCGRCTHWGRPGGGGDNGGGFTGHRSLYGHYRGGGKAGNPNGIGGHLRRGGGGGAFLLVQNKTVVDMIDWLKYYPLRLRDCKEGDSVKGPVFSKARPVKLNFRDNIIRLRAPRHRSTTGYSPIYTTGFKAASADQFQTRRGGFTENWKASTLLFRKLDYRCEWFGGRSGGVSISLSVLARVEGKEFKDSSFFYPGAFESAIANFLNTFYGVQKPGRAFTRRAPVNWQVQHHLPVFSCTFELWQRNLLSRIYFFFPLTDRHLGCISFDFTVSDEGPVAQAKELVSQIINSVQLELSPESQAQLDQAKQAMGELKLTEDFAPLKWPIKVEDIEQPLASGSFLSHSDNG